MQYEWRTGVFFVDSISKVHGLSGGGSSNIYLALHEVDMNFDCKAYAKCKREGKDCKGCSEYLRSPLVSSIFAKTIFWKYELSDKKKVKSGAY